MKQLDAGRKLFQVKPNSPCEQYDRKTVEFIYELDEKLILLTGRFAVRNKTENECVDIHFDGQLDPVDPPGTYYVFHLSQAHLNSTHPAKVPGAKVDFLMERPLWSRECVKEATTEDRQAF